MIKVMGTSFVNDRATYLLGIPSKALNEKLESLLWLKDRGQDPHLLFVICRNDANCFYANQGIDPYFADLLDEVKEAGILIEAVRCVVDEDGMTIDSIVPLR
jgi:DNA-binding sugar fermentation-stimulating protein